MDELHLTVTVQAVYSGVMVRFGFGTAGQLNAIHNVPKIDCCDRIVMLGIMGGGNTSWTHSCDLNNCLTANKLRQL